MANDKSLSQRDLNILIDLAQRVMWAGPEIHRELQKHRIFITPARFYADIPSVDEVEASFEYGEPDGPYNDPALFDADRMRRFLAKIAPFAGEFSPPNSGDVEAPKEYFWENPLFSHADAMAYWSVIRFAKPARIIEVGAGFSSLIALSALAANGGGQLWCVEPHPSDWLSELATDGRLTLVREKAQTLPPRFFHDRLGNGDILFIDSTHTVKIGSDCLHLYLRVLPRLRRNVLVHAHDICLPYPFPMRRALYDQVHWTEQYLLYAYLLENPKTRILFASHFMGQALRDDLVRFMHGRAGAGGGSFWFSLGGDDQAFDPSR